MDRIISVTLTKGPPWGFRLKGGEGTESPIIVARVNRNGQAYREGIREGDRLTSVNGRSTDNQSHASVQQMIRNSAEYLTLEINRSCSESDPRWQPSTEHGDPAANDLQPPDDNPLTDECDEEMKFAPDLCASAVLDIPNSLSSSATSSTSTCSTTIFVNCGQQMDASFDSKQQLSDDATLSESDATQIVWSPGQTPPPQPDDTKESSRTVTEASEEVGPVWQPFGGPADTPQFRKVKLEMPSTPPPPETKPETTVCESTPEATKEAKEEPPVVSIDDKCQVSTEDTNTRSTPPVSLSPSSSTTFTKTGRISNLPPSQSPTITLLQKAREGQIPRGAVYIDDKDSSRAPLLPKNAVLIDQKVTVDGDKVHTDSYYAIPTQETTSSSTIVKAPKYDGIGPTEYGIPIGLRTSVKDEYASDWYKTMYRTLHRSASEGGHAVHQGGYMSEPEYDRNDSYYRRAKYATVDLRRKPEKSLSHDPEPQTLPRTYKTESSVLLPALAHSPHETYKNQPRSIAEYEPGHSSIADKEFQKFWDDFWDSVGDLQQHLHHSPRKQLPVERKWPNTLFSDGYESDSTLIRKTGKIHRLDPQQQKAWYREVQKGGEIPFTGLGKVAPEKPKAGSQDLDATHLNKSASPHQYQVSEVNIHYRSPIRNLEKEYIEEEELRKRQEEAMKKFYEEEKYRKRVQQLAEIEMRRHCDFYTPSQKSPIPLNRYDNPFDTETVPVNKTPEPRTLARALFGFTAQTSRELGFNKGDIIYINKKIDMNWYEGEHHGQIGIFPVNYVEIIPFENANLQPRKATEGVATVKYNFRAQTPMELSLFKSETVILVRRVDQNWYEGRIGTKKGIFPASYVNVSSEPGEPLGSRNISPKPPTTQIFSSIVNGAPPQKVQPSPILNRGINAIPQKFCGRDIAFAKTEEKQPITQSLHIDTYNEPIPYRSLYAYNPQNEDELELREGDTVYVMEKCDDGWYVGTSLRTGLFGTFPGNYVERI